MVIDLKNVLLETSGYACNIKSAINYDRVGIDEMIKEKVGDNYLKLINLRIIIEEVESTDLNEIVATNDIDIATDIVGLGV